MYSVDRVDPFPNVVAALWRCGILDVVQEENDTRTDVYMCSRIFFTWTSKTAICSI